MLLNYLLVCLVCISSSLSILSSLFSSSFEWLWVSLGVLLLTLSLFLFLPMQAGWLGLIALIVFLSVPKRIFSRTNWLIDQQRYREARILISRSIWLHPFPSFLRLPKLLNILETAQRGDMFSAVASLESYSEDDYQARVLVYFIKADWDKCLDWMEKLPRSVLSQNPELLIYYIRALGETGKLNQLLSVFADRYPLLKKKATINQLNLARLYVLVFCGQILQVKQLFNSFLSFYPKYLQKFWLSSVQLIGANKYAGRHQLLDIRLERDFILSNAIDWRLCYPPPDPNSVLDSSSLTILQRITGELSQELRSHSYLSIQKSIPYITLSLLLINTSAFVAEIWLGGNQDESTLYKLGALVPSAVFQGEWWRIITANFLHFGWFHFATNMLGLIFIGRIAEFILGRIFFSFIYFAAGTGSLLIFTLLARRNQLLDTMLVGASAAIMGLIGAILAFYVRDWLRNRSQFALRRILLLLIILGIQFFVDYHTPQVSLLAHISGFVLGFIFTFPFSLWKNSFKSQ